MEFPEVARQLKAGASPTELLPTALSAIDGLHQGAEATRLLPIHSVQDHVFERIKALGTHLEAALELVEKDLAVPALSIVRVALERQLIDEAIFRGARRVVLCKRGNSSMTTAQVEQIFHDDPIITAFEKVRKGYRLRLGPYPVTLPDGSKAYDLNAYYVALYLERYDGYLPAALAGALDPWHRPHDEAFEFMAQQRGMFEFGAVLETLHFDGHLAEDGVDVLRIHYSFLSRFVHGVARHNDLTYVADLVCLYIAAMAARELDALAAYLDQETLDIGGAASRIRDRARSLHESANDLWFPGHSPGFHDDLPQQWRDESDDFDGPGYHPDPLERIKTMRTLRPI